MNPIYYFYESVALGPDSNAGKPSDKFYQCCHGGKKVLKITKKMKNNLNSMSHKLLIQMLQHAGVHHTNC